MHFFAPSLRRSITPSEAEVQECQCVKTVSLHTRGQPNIFGFRRPSKHTFLTLVHQLISCTKGQPDFLPSVTQRCQCLGIRIAYLAGPSTLEVPSHFAVNIPVKSPLKHREAIKNYWWKAKNPKCCCFLSDFCTQLIIVAM